MADAHFEVPRLAEIYDALDPDRSDLDVYRSIARELDAQAVVDLGCGTGTFACMLTGEGIRVIGLDPATASLNVARKKPGADRVIWVHGDAGALLDLEIEVDLVTMTGNVAHVFVSDDEWSKTLAACHVALRPGGHLVFESRVPEDEAWRRWTRDSTYKRTRLQDAGTAGPADTVEYWVEVTETRQGVVSFRSTYVFESDGVRYESDSTLRFRGRGELTASLEAQDFEVAEVRDAPDRPGREYVFFARRREP